MSYKNNDYTYKEIVERVRNVLEWHQEMAEDNEVTLQHILDVYKKSDIQIEGGFDLQ
jgi:hypothetical protein